MKKALWLAARVVLVGAILFFLGLFVRRNWNELATMQFAFHPLPFVISTLLVFALYLQHSTCWWIILTGVSKPMPWREAIAVWFASQVSKYVPGKVMLPLVRMGLCRRRGIDPGRVTMAIYLELSLMTGGIIAVSAATSFGWSPKLWDSLATLVRWPGGGDPLRYVVFLLIPGTLVAVHPRLLEWVINLGLRLIKKDAIRIDLSYGKLLLLGSWYIAGWIVYSFACWLLMVSLGVDDPSRIPPLAGAFAISWVVGFLSFVTPGGVGVREAVLIGMLGWQGVPLGAATAAAALCRLQWTSMEIVGAALTVRDRPAPLNELEETTA
jgi:uncharacterized membrane protein YbhN (UPF0104 family)